MAVKMYFRQRSKFDNCPAQALMASRARSSSLFNSVQPKFRIRIPEWNGVVLAETPAETEVCDDEKAKQTMWTPWKGCVQMMQTKFGELIQDGIAEGQRFALSSDLWRFASASGHCDVLVTLKPGSSPEESAELAVSLVDLLKKFESQLKIEVRHHRLTNCFALYISASYVSLLKGAELCHIKKTVKPRFGGALRDFCFEEAQCYSDIELRSTFLSGMERALIVKQIIDMMRAPRGGIQLRVGGEVAKIQEGRAVVPALMSKGFIDNILPLHQSDSIKHLQQSWVLTLFEEQPLELINGYFGTEIAMYFAWLGHMTTALWFPAIIGCLMFFFGGFKYSALESPNDNFKPASHQLFSDICFVSFALFNCFWSTTYLELWKRKQAELAFKWGTYDVASDPLLEDPRPAFKGDYFAANPVSGRTEPQYPAWKHSLIRYGVTYPITFICIVFMFFAMFCTFKLQEFTNFYFGESSFFWWLPSVPMIFYALLIVIGDSLYRNLALFLNDLENYRTDDEYEDFLITKIVLYQCVTAFGSLFYIAFYERNLKRLQETLATLLITRQVTQNVNETVVPFIMERVKLSRLTYKMTKSMSDRSLRMHCAEVRRKRATPSTSEANCVPSPEESAMSFTFESTNRHSPRQICRNKFHSMRLRRTGDDNPPLKLLKLRNNALSPPTTEMSSSSGKVLKSPRLPLPEFKFSSSEAPELTQAELESVMSAYTRPLDDYLEMFIQFGYVLLFSPAFPLAAVCALANNLIEIRVDAFKLCNTVQRPFGRRVKDIGAWQKAMELMGIAGVLVNCALIGQSGLVQRIWPELSWGGQILIVVILEHLVLATKYFIDFAIPDIPYWIRIETAKAEHFRREAFKNETKLLTAGKKPRTEDLVGNVRLLVDGIEVSSNGSGGLSVDGHHTKRRSVTPMFRPSTLNVCSHADRKSKE